MMRVFPPSLPFNQPALQGHGLLLPFGPLLP